MHTTIKNAASFSPEMTATEKRISLLSGIERPLESVLMNDSSTVATGRYKNNVAIAITQKKTCCDAPHCTDSAITIIDGLDTPAVPVV